MSNNYTIYIHKNKINNKVYIGQTKQNPQKRWDNGRGYETSSRFYNAILKYGWDNFEHLILYTGLSEKEAEEKEKELIAKYNSTNEKFGYNIQPGGKSTKHSEETKRKIGAANAISLKGKKLSPERCALISEMFMGENNPFYGKHHTDETKEKISSSRKGKCVGEQHPMYGKKHTEEALLKISKNRTGKGGKAVICINTGEIFDCIMDAARWCGLANGSSISQACRGNQKTAGIHPITKEKLQWKYYERKNSK